MPPTFQDFPRELVDSVLKLICFPLLYHTVGLVNEDHAEAFIQRVLDELRDDEEGKDSKEKRNKECERRLRVTSCVRRLYIELSLEGDPERLANLGKAISKMKKLGCLHWNTVYLGELDWHHTLVLLHESLPELCSLNLVLPNVEFLLEDPDKVVALANLRGLSIKFDDPGCDEDDNPETPTAIVDLIRGASNIESLNLRFEYSDELPHNRLWAFEIFSALTDVRFSNLRSLRSRCLDFAPLDLFDRSVLRQFIRNHTQLHTVVLDTDGSGTSVEPFEPDSVIIAPEEMVELFPLIRHFEGPCIMAEALLRSKLAEQIETLGIIESSSEKMGYLDELLPLLDNLTTLLPHLKVLKINSNTVTWEDTLSGLAKFALNMPVLEELLMGEAMTSSRECAAPALVGTFQL